MEDVDAIHQRCLEQGLDVTWPPTDMPWNVREMYVDRAHAAAARHPPGGDIMIHGIRNGVGFLGSLHRVYDWTQGCIAVTDGEIEELWRVVPDGTPIEIRP